MRLGTNELLFGSLCFLVGGGLAGVFAASAAHAGTIAASAALTSGAAGVLTADKVMGPLGLEDGAPAPAAA